ncbi:MAG: mannose-1-phosphate guanylyltransferase [Rhodospirillaceae bacterium]|nr:mannose-1-phosphate guanylyltransferase [Rhodospirillaceae bacterium]
MIDRSKINAFILAAGLGKRMRYLTKEIPKPLVKVNNKPLIDYSLDYLNNFGISNIIINLHYKSEELRAYLEIIQKKYNKMNFRLSFEKDALLDTGGGIAKGLKYISSDLFFIINSDTIRVDKKNNTMNEMLCAWDAKSMDFLLLLIPKERVNHYGKLGDFHLSKNNIVTRINSNSLNQYVYTGLCIASTSVFLNTSENIFSINKLWDTSILRSRVYGMIYPGYWLHVGTPEELEYAEKKLRVIL